MKKVSVVSLEILTPQLVRVSKVTASAMRSEKEIKSDIKRCLQNFARTTINAGLINRVKISKFCK